MTKQTFPLIETSDRVKNLTRELFCAISLLEEEMMIKEDEDCMSVILSSLLNVFCDIALGAGMSDKESKDMLARFWKLKKSQHSAFFGEDK